MNILLIGFGSIGSRHLKNILALGYKNVAVVSSTKKLPEEISSLKAYKNIKEAVSSSKFDAAIVCTPTAQHISNVIELLQHNIKNIYLEKPISNNYNKISDVLQVMQEKNARIIVGYDLRFDPGLQKLKELITRKIVGKPISINAIVGQYLPDWRPHQDYTKSMSAKIETGGGVMLDLIHEFDYLYWLIGDVKTIAAQYIHSNSLNIETEDAAEVLLKFENNVIGTIHLDYLQPALVRHCMITCTNGSIFWDTNLSEVKCINQNKETFYFSYKDFKRNDRFIQIVKTFLEDKKDERLTTFNEGLKSLKMVLAAKQSSEQQKFIQLNQENF
ncbi:MAG: Gfo/Idh/MocA family protein [Chitinophagaceae bacterium]